MSTTTPVYNVGDGQIALAGPGLERSLDTKITGSEPDGAKLKLTGASVEWDGPQLQRAERHTLIVEVVVKGVGIEDDLDDAGYPKKTWRVHSAVVESVRMADPLEVAHERRHRQGESDEPPMADDEVRAEDLVPGARIRWGGQEREVLGIPLRQTGGPVRIALDGGEIIELAASDPVGVA